MRMSVGRVGVGVPVAGAASLVVAMMVVVVVPASYKVYIRRENCTRRIG